MRDRTRVGALSQDPESLVDPDTLNSSTGITEFRRLRYVFENVPLGAITAGDAQIIIAVMGRYCPSVTPAQHLTVVH